MNNLTVNSYSLLAVIFHWLAVPLVLGLFGLGLWMDSLDYYHAWYQKAPQLHVALGVTLAILIFGRIIYRTLARYPSSLPTHARWERISARIAHVFLYLLMVGMFVTGYLIITAEGDPLSVYGWFEVPSVISSDANLQDIAGEIHEYAAFVLIGLVVIHALAALKLHFFDKDDTLRRMLGLRPRRNRVL